MQRFEGKRVLVTSADTYMGPAIVKRFTEAGAAEVIADNGRYRLDPEEPARIVAAAGDVDILVVNLIPEQLAFKPATETVEDEWQAFFDALVHPTMRFVKAVLPQMIARKEGKIIAVTSAIPLRGLEGSSSYSAARGAQNAYVRTVGSEVARSNVQINAVAQGYVYGGFPDNALDDPAIRDAVMRDVPARRLAEGWEQADLVLFLASQSSNFISGQVMPFAGGWVT